MADTVMPSELQQVTKDNRRRAVAGLGGAAALGPAGVTVRDPAALQTAWFSKPSSG